MTSLGITGGIGSGKTALVARLAEHPGVRVLLADDLAKQLMVEDPEVRRQLVDRFGPEAYYPDGSLNREIIAARVFSDPDELAALNAIVHPAVRRAMLAAMETAREDGVRMLVYEAALIFETGADKVLDHVVVVDAPVETRIARAMARDGMTRDEVLARMDRQLDPAEGRRRADTVINNDGSLADLRERADGLVRQLAG